MLPLEYLISLKPCEQAHSVALPATPCPKPAVSPYQQPLQTRQKTIIALSQIFLFGCLCLFSGTAEDAEMGKQERVRNCNSVMQTY